MVDDRLTDKDMVYAYNQVAVDSTRWDKITGTVLKNRIATVIAQRDKFERMADLISCLRLANVYYMRKKEGDVWQVPTLDTPEGSMLLLFTAKSQAKNERYKEYELDCATYSSIIKSLSDKPKIVVFNPDTQALALPVESIDKMIQSFDVLEDDLDSAMREGITDKDIFPLMFERFLGRRVECVTRSGTICGDAGMYGKEGKRAYLDVDLADNSKRRLYYDEVVSIKDITE